MSHHANTEVDRNFDAFQAMLPDLLQTAPGKFALLHRAQVVELFETSVSAVVAGLRKFGQDDYSVQEVCQVADNLGFYSYAGGSAQA